MTFFAVVLFGLGALLIYSGLENKSIVQGFADIVSGKVAYHG